MPARGWSLRAVQGRGSAGPVRVRIARVNLPSPTLSADRQIWRTACAARQGWIGRSRNRRKRARRSVGAPTDSVRDASPGAPRTCEDSEPRTSGRSNPTGSWLGEGARPGLAVGAPPDDLCGVPEARSLQMQTASAARCSEASRVCPELRSHLVTNRLGGNRTQPPDIPGWTSALNCRNSLLSDDVRQRRNTCAGLSIRRFGVRVPGGPEVTCTFAPAPPLRERSWGSHGSVGGFVVRRRLFRAVPRRVPACDNVSIEPCL